MANFTLKAASPFAGLRLDHPNLTIEGVSDRALVSIMAHHNDMPAMASAVQSAYSTALPSIGKFVTSAAEPCTFLGMAADQFLLMFDHPGRDPSAHVRQKIGQSAYVVDQSDGWVGLTLGGENCRAALERICPLDLEPAKFAPGSVSRTAMEHLAVIIMCEAPNRYRLLSPRSSAQSFLHAIDISARNVA